MHDVIIGMALDISMLKTAFGNAIKAGPVAEVDEAKGYRIRLGGSDAGGPFGGFPSQPGCRTVLCPSLVSGGLGGIFRLERGEGAPFLGCFGH